MHERNETLIKRSHAHLGRGERDLNDRARERLEKFLTDYEVAAKLAKGPKESRAAHWSVIARERERILKRCVDSLDT